MAPRAPPACLVQTQSPVPSLRKRPLRAGLWGRTSLTKQGREGPGWAVLQHGGGRLLSRGAKGTWFGRVGGHLFPPPELGPEGRSLGCPLPARGVQEEGGAAAGGDRG